MSTHLARAEDLQARLMQVLQPSGTITPFSSAACLNCGTSLDSTRSFSGASTVAMFSTAKRGVTCGAMGSPNRSTGRSPRNANARPSWVWISGTGAPAAFSSS